MQLKNLKKKIISKKYKYIIKKVKTNEYYSEYGYDSLTKDKNKATIFYGKDSLEKFFEGRPQFLVRRFYRICQIGFYYEEDSN